MARFIVITVSWHFVYGLPPVESFRKPSLLHCSVPGPECGGTPRYPRNSFPNAVFWHGEAELVTARLWQCRRGHQLSHVPRNHLSPPAPVWMPTRNVCRHPLLFPICLIFCADELLVRRHVRLVFSIVGWRRWNRQRITASATTVSPRASILSDRELGLLISEINP